MAKKQVEKAEAKANIYLLAIVAIVAIVGVVIMILNSGTGSISLSESDLSGQVTASKASTKVSFTPLSSLKSVVKTTDVTYVLEDGTTGSATVYPVKTATGKTLLTKSTLSSKSSIYALIVDSDKDIIGSISTAGRIASYEESEFTALFESAFYSDTGRYWMNENLITESMMEDLFNVAATGLCEGCTACVPCGGAICCY